MGFFLHIYWGRATSRSPLRWEKRGGEWIPACAGMTDGRGARPFDKLRVSGEKMGSRFRGSKRGLGEAEGFVVLGEFDAGFGEDAEVCGSDALDEFAVVELD